MVTDAPKFDNLLNGFGKPVESMMWRSNLRNVATIGRRVPPIFEMIPKQLLGVRGLTMRQVRGLLYSSERCNARAFAATEWLLPRRRATHIQCCSPRHSLERGRVLVNLRSLSLITKSSGC